MVVATGGYATFGSKVSSDLLLSYPQTPAVMPARVALTTLVVFSYPVAMRVPGMLRRAEGHLLR